LKDIVCTAYHDRDEESENLSSTSPSYALVLSCEKAATRLLEDWSITHLQFIGWKAPKAVNQLRELKRQRIVPGWLVNEHMSAGYEKKPGGTPEKEAGHICEMVAAGKGADRGGCQQYWLAHRYSLSQVILECGVKVSRLE
jgi:hypothetical protein